MVRPNKGKVDDARSAAEETHFLKNGMNVEKKFMQVHYLKVRFVSTCSFMLPVLLFVRLVYSIDLLRWSCLSSSLPHPLFISFCVKKKKKINEL